MDDPDVNGALTNTSQPLTDRRWFEIIDIISENLSSSWQGLARHLGLSREAIANIDKKFRKQRDKIWQTLAEWKAQTQPIRRQHQLVYALNQISHKRLADIVVLATTNPGDINRLLAPYLQREARMREAFYLIADGVHKQWRRLAKKLGLSPADVASIERSNRGRTREKCLNMLYKWRLMAGLNDYKLATLVQVLSACRLTTLAGRLQIYDVTSQIPLPTRKKQKDEVIIHVGVDTIEHQPFGREVNPFITTSILKEYALNKIFVRFQDSLELQVKDSLHDLVTYFHRVHRANVKEVSRRTRTIVLRCESRDQAREIVTRTRDGEISAKLNEVFVTDDILDELGLIELKLRAEICDESCPAETSEGSETYRSQIDFIYID